MKLKKILPIIPLVAALTGCGGTAITVPEKKAAGLTDPALTEAPVGFVVFPDDRPSVPDGKVVWEKQNCAQCHGAGGAGGTATVRLDDKLYMHGSKPVDQFVLLAYGDERINHPPLRQTLSRRQIWDLVAYTRALADPPLSEEEMQAILPVFGANCAVCHGTKGDGDGPLMRTLQPMPANFQQFQRFFDRTDDVLFDHIANGIKWEGMPNFLGKKDERNNVTFDHEYIRKLVKYVRAFHFSNEPTLTAAAPAPGAQPDVDAGRNHAPSARHRGSGPPQIPRRRPPSEVKPWRCSPPRDASYGRRGSGRAIMRT